MKKLNNSLDKAKNARERILLTAHDLFYRVGIRATGVDRLIAESNVTKTTFYRHFPSKNDLILAFLNYRHEVILQSFKTSLHVHGGDTDAICPTYADWFNSSEFRGCAFLNSLAELGETMPEAVTIIQQHKFSIMQAIKTVLPNSPQRDSIAQAIAMAMDGAIVKAQYEKNSDAALTSLQELIQALLHTTQPAS